MKRIEIILKKKGKSEKFINLIRQMFMDYNIKEETCIEILKIFYK